MFTEISKLPEETSDSNFMCLRIFFNGEHRFKLKLPSIENELKPSPRPPVNKMSMNGIDINF